MSVWPRCSMRRFAVCALLLTTAVLVLPTIEKQVTTRTALSRLMSYSSAHLAHAFDSWEECVRRGFDKYGRDSDAFWAAGYLDIAVCERESGLNDTVRPVVMRNGEDDKWHILSAREFHHLPSQVVSLGVGHNTGAEENMVKVLGPSASFLGADPVEIENRRLYQRFGRFIPVAVGGKEGNVTAQVLLEDERYHSGTVRQVEISSFLEQNVPSKIVDQIIIDIEGAEYGILPSFYKGGSLDKKKITVCQINMEMHFPSEKERRLVRDWYFRLLSDRRYVFGKMQKLRSWQQPRPAFDHERVFLFNREHPYCVGRYIAHFFPVDK